MPSSAPPPPHIRSFKEFSDRIPNNDVLAAVAFGVFMHSERRWVDQQTAEPNAVKCDNYHHDFVNNHEIERYRQNAENLLAQYANGIIDRQRSELLREHKGFRWWGVFEAMAGAFCWTVLLIVISLILVYSEIDIFSAYQRAVHRSEQHAPPTKAE
jgi:hypothetical protein